MNRTLILVATCTALVCHAQGPNAEWMATAGGFSQFEVYHSAADATGHIYTAGSGTSLMDFGGGITVPTAGRVIARYDSLGTIDWARALTTTPNESADLTAIAATLDGDLWITGYFLSATLTLDGYVLNTTSMTTSAFLARLDSNGVTEFATSWGMEQSTITTAMDVCVDDFDNVLVTGQTDVANLNAGGLSLANTIGGHQLYALKFDATGTGLWGSISDVPINGAEGCCIGADAMGNTYVAGRTIGLFVMDQDSVDAGSLTQAVLIKFDPTGAVQHVDLIAECYLRDMIVDDTGNAYVCGMIETTAIFGNDTLVPAVLDGYVAAYAPDGSYRWVVGVQGEMDNELCHSVRLNNTQTALFVGGTFVIGAWFGDVHVDTGTSPTDGFVMQLSTAGTVTWVKDMTGDGPTLFAEVCLDPWDHLYASGVTQSTTTYLDEPVLNSNGTNVFLARFGDLATSVPRTANVSDLHLFPNPSSGSFTLDVPANTRMVIIEDAQGRVLQRLTVPSSRPATFRIGTPGSYFVTVLTDAGRAVQRLNVE